MKWINLNQNTRKFSTPCLNGRLCQNPNLFSLVSRSHHYHLSDNFLHTFIQIEPQKFIILNFFQGIANALDLTDRILPRLQARPKCKYFKYFYLVM